VYEARSWWILFITKVDLHFAAYQTEIPEIFPAGGRQTLMLGPVGWNLNAKGVALGIIIKH